MRRRACVLLLLVRARALAHTPPRHGSSTQPPSSHTTAAAATTDTTTMTMTTTTTTAAAAAAADASATGDAVARARGEAEARGYARRDTAEARALLSYTFADRPRTCDGVPVANLPPEETTSGTSSPHASSSSSDAFATYTRSTSDFVSYASQQREGVPSGVGLGAGFGTHVDKRLGFLRPRNVARSNNNTNNADNSNGQLATSEAADGGLDVAQLRARGLPLPRYDEHGMLVPRSDRDALRQSRQYSEAQLRAQRSRWMQNIEGTMYSRNEHSLLIDLDYYKDAHIFGYTRAEFERNVGKLRAVILAYEQWERTDTVYRYATVVLKLLTLLLLLECAQQYHDVRLFARHYDDFVDTVASNIAEADATRARDMAHALEVLTRQPPDFAPVVAAIATERARLQRERAAAAASPQEQQQQQQQQHVSNNAAATTSSSSSRSVAAVMLDSTASHPMDTSHEQRVAAAAQRQAQAREMQRLHDRYATHAQPPSTLAVLWGRLVGDTLRRGRSSNNNDKSTSDSNNNNNNNSTKAGGAADVAGAAVLRQPLQQDDFALYSYAASPTNVAAVRAVRRVLLPRSEDYTQVVRETIAAHRRTKARRVADAPT